MSQASETAIPFYTTHAQVSAVAFGRTREGVSEFAELLKNPYDVQDHEAFEEQTASYMAEAVHNLTVVSDGRLSLETTTIGDSSRVVQVN